MSESNSTGDRLAYLLIGAGIGATLALLFAPKSGRELRRDIADASKKTYRKGAETAQGLGERVSEGISSVREGVDRQKNQIAQAIEAGRTAYREERKRGDT